MFDLTPFETGSRKNLLNLFDDFDQRFFGGQISIFKTDILEKDDRFELQAELPGFDKEDIKIDLQDDRLTISAEHKESKETHDEKTNYIHKERSFGSFSRSFHVANIDTQNISASYQNGVLTLTLPKSKPETPPSRTIEIQ